MFVGLEWLSFLHEHNGLPVTPWNPGLGLMVALIIIGGGAYTVVFFIAIVLAELLVLRSGLPLHIDLAVGAVVATSYSLVALALRAHLHPDGHNFQTRHILMLTAGGMVGAVTCSSLLCIMLLSMKQFYLTDIARTIVPLVLGDLIGIVVVTPLLLRAYGRMKLSPVAFAQLSELAGFSFVILLLLVIILQPGYPSQHLFYLLFLPVVVAAVRHGIDGACATLTIVQLMLVALLHLHGFDLSRFTEYQVLMFALTVTGLVVGGLVSERQLAEEEARVSIRKLQDLRSEAARAARLNLVSGMAAALAHEINQPMTAARALARSVDQLLRMPNGDVVRAGRNVTAMIEQIDHAGDVVRRMREFLRRGEPHVSTLDIKAVLGDALALVQSLASAHRIKLDLTVPDQLPPAFADRVQIQQVIVNLVGNSVEAIKDSRLDEGRIQISASEGAKANEIEIAVLDNGTGIDADQCKHCSTR